MLGKRKRNKDEDALDLKVIGRMVRERIERIQRQSMQPSLVLARLADAYRNVGVQPLPSAQVQNMLGVLDDEGWRRLDLIISILSNEAVGSALKDVSTQDDIV